MFPTCSHFEPQTGFNLGFAVQVRISGLDRVWRGRHPVSDPFTLRDLPPPEGISDPDVLVFEFETHPQLVPVRSPAVNTIRKR
jgi:hypothetical protein